MKEGETMKRFLLRWLINALAIWAAIEIVPGIRAEGGWTVIAVVALILGFANALLKPLLKLLTCPLVLLTLGLFTLVINAAILLFTSWLAGELGLPFQVAGFWPAFWGGLIISIAGAVLGLLVHDDDDDRRRKDRH
jgi:putative membrane protein